MSAPDTRECRKQAAQTVVLEVKLAVNSLDRVTTRNFGKKHHLTMFKIIVDFIPTPERSKRILFDQFHSLKYPQNGFIFKDNLQTVGDSNFDNTLYEWHGDHLFTNYQGMHARLVQLGYHMEILTQSWSCFDATNYKTLMIIDIEDFFGKEEILKLRRDVEIRGLSLIVVADWYN